MNYLFDPLFPERNKVPDLITFPSLAQAQLLEVVRGAYPENFERLAFSKPLGKSVFSGSTPHPSAILNLFNQQKLTPALPVGYCAATQRGFNSLMGKHPPWSATFSLEIFQPTIGGLTVLGEVQPNKTHRSAFGPKGLYPCSALNCPSPTPLSQERWRPTRRFFIILEVPVSWRRKYCRSPSSMRIVEGIFNTLALASAVAVWKNGGL